MKQRDPGEEVLRGNAEKGECRALISMVGVLEARGVVLSGKTCAGRRY